MDIAKWIVVGFAIAGLIFNSGILYNDIKHLKKSTGDVKMSIRDIWSKIDKIEQYLLERKDAK